MATRRRRRRGGGAAAARGAPAARSLRVREVRRPAVLLPHPHHTHPILVPQLHSRMLVIAQVSFSLVLALSYSRKRMHLISHSKVLVSCRNVYCMYVHVCVGNARHSPWVPGHRCGPVRPAAPSHPATHTTRCHDTTLPTDALSAAAACRRAVAISGDTHRQSHVASFSLIASETLEPIYTVEK